MKYLCKLLTSGQIKPKTIILVIIAFSAGHISPEVLTTIINALAE